MSKVIDLEEKRKKIVKKKFIIYIMLGIISIYIISAIYLIMKTPTDTVTVDKGMLTFEESTTGYIIRNEKLVKGKKYKNGMYQIVSEGERAAKNQAIFRYYGDNEEKLQKQIGEVNLKIQEALEKEKINFPSDIKNLDERIEQKMKDINEITDVQELSEIKKDINDLIEKKAKISGESSAKGSYIKKLINQKEKYEKQLESGSETIKASMSGVVSYRVDGLENVLKVDDFSNLTSEVLENLNLKTGKIISTNDESAKIIDNFGCYIATVVDSYVAKDSKQGDNVKITLSSGNEVTGTIDYKKEQEDGQTLIVFKITTLTEELISYRKISCNITWWRYSGLKVPNDAITEDGNGLKYVLKKTVSGTSKVLIKVLKTNDKYSIISTYSTEDLKALGIDATESGNIDVYDTIMMYPGQR